MARSASDPSSDLNEKVLFRELIDVRWDTLGALLGFRQSEIREIEHDHQNEARRKIVLISLWLKKEPAPSWLKLIDALEVMSENKLASQLKEKYVHHQQDERLNTTTCGKPIPKPRSRLVSELKVDRKDQVARDLECLKAKYFELVTNAELALKTANPPAEKLKRFSQMYMKDRLVTTVEELFDCLGQLCFLDYALLESVVTILLKQSQSVVDDLNYYVQQLSDFKKSTTLSKFIESIEKTHTMLTKKGATMCIVKIRLVGGWLEKTMEDLDRLLKEIFQDKASILNHLKIVRGSIIIKYLAPLAEKKALICQAKTLDSSLLPAFGVWQLLIEETEIINSKRPASFSFESFLISAIINSNTKLLKFLLDIQTDPNFFDPGRGWSALVYGSYFGNDEAVRLLLKANAKPDLKINDGVTALCLAVERRHSVIVGMLLQANADPNVQRQSDGTSPLYIAAEKGFSDMVSILLKAKANPDLQVDYGATALFVAAQNGHTSTVSALLKASANPNITKNNGVTPLYMAARYNHFDVANLLLQANADPDLHKDNGTTPLYMAAQNGLSDIVHILVEANANPNCQKHDGTTPIFMASQFRHTETVRILLHADANPNIQRYDGVSPLYIAAYMGYTDIVGILLHAKANPNLQAKSGITPLFMAAQFAFCTDIVYILLIAKANPNLPNQFGITPIFMASLLGHTKIVNILLHANANPNFQKSDGISPIFMASQFGHSDVVNILLKFKADPNLQRNDGVSPLYQATFKGYYDIVSSLLKANANPNIQTDDGSTPLYMAAQAGRSDIVNILLEAKADPNLQNSNGATPLCIASQEGHTDTVRILLKAEANPNVRTRDDVTPLMSACLKRCPAVVDQLLKSGADPNLHQSKGTTALMLASYAGCLDSVELLLKFGADPSIVGPKGSTALSMAVSSGHDYIADLIRAKQLSQSSAISPATTHAKEITDTHTSEKIDNRTMAILTKAIENMLVAKAETIISTQDKLFDKNLPQKPSIMHAVK